MRGEVLSRTIPFEARQLTIKDRMWRSLLHIIFLQPVLFLVFLSQKEAHTKVNDIMQTGAKKLRQKRIFCRKLL